MKSLIVALILLAGVASSTAESLGDLVKNGRYREADQQLQNLYEGDPENPEYLLLMGRTAASGENCATALKDYINKSPQNAILADWARLMLGKYYLSQGLYVTAGKQFESIEDDSPFFTESSYLAARCLLFSEESHQAVAAFESCLEDRQRGGSSGQTKNQFWRGWASLGLADSYAAQRDYNKAEAGYRRLLEAEYKESVMAPALLGLIEIAGLQNKIAADYHSTYARQFGSYQPPLSSDKPVVREESPGAEKLRPKSRHYIQVGVYSKRENALKISSLYKKSGYEVYMESFEKEGQEYYRILIGGYESKQQAEFIKNRLEKASDEKFILLER